MEGESRLINKEGVVSVVYPERHSARVEFEDKDGLISAELPVVTPLAGGNKVYAMPDVGETVVCLFASNADQTGEGWIINSRYHDKCPPAVSSQDITRIDFKDGTYIQYDRASHDLRISCVGNIYIDAKNIYMQGG